MIKTIAVKQFYAILNSWCKQPSMIPRSQWMTFDKGKFLIIDNEAGKCEVKEFVKIEDVLDWRNERGTTNEYL